MKKIELIRQVIIAWKIAYMESEIAKYCLPKMDLYKDRPFNETKFANYYDHTLYVPTLNEDQNKYLCYVLNNGECHLTAAVLYAKLRKVIGEKLVIASAVTIDDELRVKGHTVLKVGDWCIDSLAISKNDWFAETIKERIKIEHVTFSKFTETLFKFDPDGKALFDSFVTEEERNFAENN